MTAPDQSPGLVTLERPSVFLDSVGRQFGPSAWMTITQTMIDQFAEATTDYQWIHCDPARAARELPGGKTIAHGYLTLSLLIPLQASLVKVDNVRHALNYGANRLRFVSPVPVDSRIRLVQTVTASERLKDGAIRTVMDCTFELEGSPKPALVAEVVGLYYEA
jgi:acyl dehydratase